MPGPITRLLVSGMTCGNCVRHVSDALQSVVGVAFATVDLASSSAVVRWQPGSAASPQGLVDAVKTAGFAAKPVEESSPEATAPPVTNPWRSPLALGLPVTVGLLAADWVFGLGMNRSFQWAAFILALPVQVWLGGRFYRGAWQQLRVGGANMDTLVSLGSTTAFFYSLWALLAGLGGHLYFGEAVSILTLVSLGHFLEARMSARAGSAVRALLDLTPATAWRAGTGDSATEVPVRELQAGDEILLRPGDRVPVDAIVISGNSAVDESLLTGESLPVEKIPGTALLTGTLNQSGRLRARVTATGETTALAQIVAAVQRAQGTRASVQRLADRVSAVFVPVVVAVAVAAGLGWALAPAQALRIHQALAVHLWPVHPPAAPVAGGILVFCSVLIVACPCAMGLATPVALMAGVNAGARRGILIRDAQALETSGRITTVVFDKTGTLTLGRPVVMAQEDFRPAADRVVPLAELAASLARPSQHPLSRSLAALAPGGLELSDWEELRGAGVTARWWNRKLEIGSVASFHAAGPDLTAAAEFIGAWTRQGATPTLLLADGCLWGAFALRDELRPEAVDVIAQLGASGLEVFLLSGDHHRAAAAIAKAAGIPETRVFSEVRPEEKAGQLRRLQAEGRRVAFVGDGINDGPALAAADLGIAVARASDVAREAAGLVLLRADLNAVPEALALAQATLRTIRQNLFWAFFYNAAAVPLAALGFLSPVVCALTMGLSDIVVVGNALRLRRPAKRRTGIPIAPGPGKTGDRWVARDP